MMRSILDLPHFLLPLAGQSVPRVIQKNLGIFSKWILSSEGSDTQIELAMILENIVLLLLLG